MAGAMATKGSLKTILGNLFSGCLNGLFFAILKIAEQCVSFLKRGYGGKTP